MAYVIAEPCIGTKDRACVDACPVEGGARRYPQERRHAVADQMAEHSGLAMSLDRLAADPVQLHSLHEKPYPVGI